MKEGTVVAHYQHSVKRKVLILVLLTAILLCSVLYSVSVGTVSIPLKELIGIVTQSGEGSMNAYIVYEIRLPRIVMAIITGMALASAGVIMQVLLRNPLASPFTLGVSSGASFGAALAIVLGTSVFGINLTAGNQWMIALNAFVFGCLSVFLVYGISRMKSGSTTVLLLAGVAIGQLFSAGVSALKYFSNNEALKDLVVWLMGGFWGSNWQVIQFLVPLVFVSFLILLKFSWDLNALSSGEEVAKTLGVNVKRLRIAALFLVTLVASATIAFTGIIGFIGLVAPHIGRMIIGVDNRYLLPCACLMGAIILLLSDTFARTVLSPIEIPVGIITSAIGAPFFIWLLVQKRKDYWA
ncbi:ABC-type Fe3+-siderophore transport system, permease component [Bacillus sp. OxB-1]|uniref:FecCD family ABC transporter permease n=1 Tax=Bacillus sp. (strain OxB-1) TaxID=98228 RepID=UPI000581C00A|nr:iron ABC transporter permease [Bacillus sp. OxB-1]BAQ09710.1 ABC-type Fe3+-siderophore transport system, permease component [Bacillus sp. OxB-1]